MKYVLTNSPLGPVGGDYMDLSGDRVTCAEAQGMPWQGDVVLWDKTAKKQIKVKAQLGMNKTYPSDKYTPVGVVVLPAAHRTAEGSVSSVKKDTILSLKYMDRDNADSGSFEPKNMYWAWHNVDIPGINQLGGGSAGEPYYNPGFRLPSGEANLDFACFAVGSNIAKYSDSNSHLGWRDLHLKLLSVPYDDKGATERFYWTADQTGEGTADFNGRELCKAMTDCNHTQQADWKTTAKVDGFVPAACAWRYHTEGTSRGDWWIPSLGEFGYIVAQFDIINLVGGILNEEYGPSTYAPLAPKATFWTSSVFDKRFAWSVGASSGKSAKNGKASNCYVRAVTEYKGD